MTQRAIIKNREGEILEVKNFSTKKGLEVYVAANYESGIFDWVIQKELEETKPNKHAKELGYKFSLKWVNNHYIVIW